MKAVIFALLFFIPVTFFTVQIPEVAAKSTVAVTDIQDCTYWITASSGKRHNSKCRWYKNSKGYCTDEKEGVGCKKCGG